MNERGRTRKKQLLKMFKRQKGRCYLCGGQMALKLGLDHTATIDHVIPRSKVDNPSRFFMSKKTRKAACFKCNNEKGDEIIAGEFQ